MRCDAHPHREVQGKQDRALCRPQFGWVVGGDTCQNRSLHWLTGGPPGCPPMRRAVGFSRAAHRSELEKAEKIDERQTCLIAELPCILKAASATLIPPGGSEGPSQPHALCRPLDTKPRHTYTGNSVCPNCCFASFNRDVYICSSFLR